MKVQGRRRSTPQSSPRGTIVYRDILRASQTMSQTKPQRPALSRAREMRVETDGMRGPWGGLVFYRRKAYELR